MTFAGLYFIYGLSVMFFFMMAWLFLRKNRELLSRLVAALMILIGVQYLKDVFFITPEMGADNFLRMVMTSTDMVAVPFYAFILIELCHPGVLTLRNMVLHGLPFVAFPLLFLLTHNSVFYYIDVGWAAIYGVGYFVWTVLAIPRYHRLLKQQFSYDDNINLNWLSKILFSFFFILTLWIVDCLIVNLDIEAVYMLGSLVIWMFICYFIYRHESVIDELSDVSAFGVSAGPEETDIDNDLAADDLKARIMALFETDRIYLNPQLKLSDIAAMTNSNRTYVSRTFNGHHGKTFFEFVNEYRVSYAKGLLKTTGGRLDVIAGQSGFNSRQSFHRVFSKIAGCTPEQYRQNPNN